MKICFIPRDGHNISNDEAEILACECEHEIRWVRRAASIFLPTQIIPGVEYNPQTKMANYLLIEDGNYPIIENAINSGWRIWITDDNTIILEERN